MNTSDVADWNGAQEMIQQAIETFGGLDILINNAGILRDRMLVNMTEQEWDAVIRVHLKGTFAPMHHAANYWRRQSKAGKPVDGRIIQRRPRTPRCSPMSARRTMLPPKAESPHFPKSRRASFSRIGVTVNAIAPRANTRMTEGLRDYTEEQIERRDPEWIAALVAWLAKPRIERDQRPGVRGLGLRLCRARKLAAWPADRGNEGPD